MEDLVEMDEETQMLFEEIGRAITEEESEPQILNVFRLLQMVHAYKQLQEIASDNWKISSSTHTPFTSMGVICIEADEFIFDQMQAFRQIIMDASNVEVFPLINGNIRMNITFHGITKRVERGGGAFDGERKI